MITNKIVFIRHGESTWNKDNKFCGWYDAELSEKGIEDAYKIAAFALNENHMQFDVAFTSALIRAKHTLDIILKEINCTQIPVISNWRLNERHYGNLIGFNKRQTADKYGEEQVQIWRRSFAVQPPPITAENPFYDSIRNNPSFATIPPDQFPSTESLETVMQRLLPLWQNEIMTQIVQGKKVLIVAHGTVLRAMMKYLEDISDENISKLNVPNSIPCVYEINLETGKPVGDVLYLANKDFLKKQIEKVASIGK